MRLLRGVICAATTAKHATKEANHMNPIDTLILIFAAMAAVVVFPIILPVFFI